MIIINTYMHNSYLTVFVYSIGFCSLKSCDLFLDIIWEMVWLF